MPSTRLDTLFGLIKRLAAPLALVAALITGGSALAATPTANGKLLLSATSGVGAYAAAVPQK